MTSVTRGGPASQAGIAPGDIITHIGDTALDETHSYINTLFHYKPGDQVTVTLARGQQTLQVQVTLSEAGAQ